MPPLEELAVAKVESRKKELGEKKGENSHGFRDLVTLMGE